MINIPWSTDLKNGAGRGHQNRCKRFGVLFLLLHGNILPPGIEIENKSICDFRWPRQTRRKKVPLAEALPCLSFSIHTIFVTPSLQLCSTSLANNLTNQSFRRTINGTIKRLINSTLCTYVNTKTKSAGCFILLEQA